MMQSRKEGKCYRSLHCSCTMGCAKVEEMHKGHSPGKARWGQFRDDAVLKRASVSQSRSLGAEHARQGHRYAGNPKSNRILVKQD